MFLKIDSFGVATKVRKLTDDDKFDARFEGSMVFRWSKETDCFQELHGDAWLDVPPQKGEGL